jgi:hypothetical protein
MVATSEARRLRMCPGTATRSGNCPPEHPPPAFGQRAGRLLYAQAVAGITGRQGRIANVARQNTAALPLGLEETTIPGGRYLRLRLIGDAPGVYGQIAAAFD